MTEEKQIKDYKDLRVWQKALDVVCDVIDLVDALPPGPASVVVGRQIIASSTSVCANIAEGHSSGSSKEFNRILRIAFREAKETDNWLQVIQKSRKFAQKKVLSLVQDIEEKNVVVLKMLVSLRKSIQNRTDKK